MKFNGFEVARAVTCTEIPVPVLQVVIHNYL